MDSFIVTSGTAVMKDTQFYEQLLGLSTPWSVERVELWLEGTGGVVTVHVKCDRGTVWGDPDALGQRAHVHGWVRREWRHLDTCQLETRIVAEVPRVKYHSGRVEEVAVPWAERYSRITRLMEAFVIQLLVAASNVKRVAALLRLDWHTVNDVIDRAVKRGMVRRAEQPVPHVGLDEKSFARHHNYASVLTDIGGSRVLDVVHGRTLEAAQQLLGTLTPEQRQGVRAAVTDMWPGYMSAIAAMLGQADIVHDKFHVSKYAWLKTIRDKRSAEALAFRCLYQADFKTSRAWALKESFAAFWEYRYPTCAANYFDSWAARTMRSRLEPLKDVAKMLRRHRQGLLNYTKHRLTNAAAEGFNSIIQTIKANARGFRNFANYRTRILFFCGKLDLRPASA